MKSLDCSAAGCVEECDEIIRGMERGDEMAYMSGFSLLFSLTGNTKAWPALLESFKAYRDYMQRKAESTTN